MKKRVLSLCLAGLMAASLTGCGGAGLAMGVSWERRYVQLGQMQRSLRMLHRKPVLLKEKKNLYL